LLIHNFEILNVWVACLTQFNESSNAQRGKKGRELKEEVIFSKIEKN
jgi:hypothetical protein